MTAPRRIYSVGHSTRPLGVFLHLLKGASVRHIADVRRYPTSRRHPWFSGPALREALHVVGIEYTHFEELGGLREDPGDVPTALGLEPEWRGYAAHLQTDAFSAALDALLAVASRQGPLAVLCAEKDPSHCHRRFLCDALVTRGADVVHLVEAGLEIEHALHPRAILENGRLTYPASQASFDF